MTAVQLQDPAGDIVEEVAVVGDRDHGAGVILEEALEPGDRFGIQVIGRLVQEQQVGLLQQRRHSATRRRSPPESVATSWSPADSAARPWRCRGCAAAPPLHRVDLLLQLGLLGHQRVHVGVRIPELRRHLVEAVEQRLGRGDALHDVAEHVLCGIELRLLRQETDARPSAATPRPRSRDRARP